MSHISFVLRDNFWIEYIWQDLSIHGGINIQVKPWVFTFGVFRFPAFEIYLSRDAVWVTVLGLNVGVAI